MTRKNRIGALVTACILSTSIFGTQIESVSATTKDMQGSFEFTYIAEKDKIGATVNWNYQNVSYTIYNESTIRPINLIFSKSEEFNNIVGNISFSWLGSYTGSDCSLEIEISGLDKLGKEFTTVLMNNSIGSNASYVMKAGTIVDLDLAQGEYTISASANGASGSAMGTYKLVVQEQKVDTTTKEPETTTKKVNSSTSNSTIKQPTNQDISRPERVKIKSAVRSKKKVKLSIKKISTKGVMYEIKYSTNNKYKNAKIKRTKSTVVTLKKLNVKKRYYIKVRAYIPNGNKKVYGSFSKTKIIK